MKRISTKFSSFWGKCLCLFSILIPCVALTANGQESFKPMLKDGRVWNCIEVYLGEEKNDTANREYRIEYASEIDGHVCYNLRLGSKPMGIYYEEGPKVFHYTASGWELLFDFSLSPGDVIPNSGGMVVDKVKTIVIKGVPRRCIYFPLTAEDGTQLCWIEGIGSSLSGPNDDNKVVIGSLLNVKLQSVYDGEVCIFEPDDLHSETSHQPLPFLEGNPIWVYKYEHISMPRDPNLTCWVDTGNRSFIYYFLGGQKEIDSRVYTMMGRVTSKGEDNITFRCWLPVREENGVVYTFTDSLLEVCEDEYKPRSRDELPYLQQGDECVLYDFCAEIGELLSPKDGYSAVESIDTYQLMDGTVCRVLKTIQGYQLCEKLGYLNFNLPLGIMAPYLPMVVPTNGHAYANRLNAFYQDEKMLYKAPDAQEGLCVNDTCWTREDAGAYARSYKADPRQEEVFSFIRQLQAATTVTFTEGQMATIILPTAPDAGKGKYYRLDRVEDGQIIFEQELHPQAHIPYIIVPSEDFSIDTSTLDLARLGNDTVSIGGISFIGSYNSEELNEPEGFYIDIIDTTPDCGFALSGETGKGAFIGALRAYLQVRWDEPYNPGGSKVPQEKMAVVLKDNGTGLTPGTTLNDKGQMTNDNWYDLQGRKIATDKSFPLKGLRGSIYIVNGRKVVR